MFFSGNENEFNGSGDIIIFGENGENNIAQTSVGVLHDLEKRGYKFYTKGDWKEVSTEEATQNIFGGICVKYIIAISPNGKKYTLGSWKDEDNHRSVFIWRS